MADEVIRTVQDGVDGWRHIPTGRFIPRIAGAQEDGGGDDGAGDKAGDTEPTAANSGGDGGTDDGGNIPDDLGDAGKEALKRERAAAKAERKRAEELAARVKEFEDRDKSEAEKQAEKLSEAEKRAEEAERSVLIHQVAAKKGLVGDLADLATRLVGSTKEELEKDADKLLKSVGAQGGAPSLDQGARSRKGGGGNAKDAMNNWLRSGAGSGT